MLINTELWFFAHAHSHAVRDTHYAFFSASINSIVRSTAMFS